MRAPSRMFMLPRSLRGKLILLVAAVIVPLAAMQATIYARWYITETRNEINSNQNLANAVGAVFQSYADNLARQELALGAALLELAPYSDQDAVDLLTRAARQNPSVRSFHWSTPEGVIILASDPNAVGIRLADRAFFADIVVADTWYVSDLFTGRATGLPTFMVARPIHDENGLLQGIISASVDPALPSTVLTAIEKPEGALVSLHDSTGALVYSDPHVGPPRPEWLADDPLLQKALDGKESSGRLICPMTGEESFGARIPIAGTRWVAGVSRSIDMTLGPLRGPLLEMFALLALVLLVSILLPHVITSRIVRSVGRLESHARAIGQGQLDHHIEIPETEEFAFLAQSLNQMASDIKMARSQTEQAYAELEKRVEERTNELREQSRILEAYFRHSLTPLVFLDKQFNFIRVNEAYAEACRKSVADFPGTNHFELYPSDELKAHFQDVVDSQTPFITFARPFVFPDAPERGTTYWDLMLVPIVNDACEIDFLVFALMEVTQRHLMEEELRTASVYARTLLEASLDPLTVISPTGLVTDLNHATEEITGANRQELIGTDFAEYFTDPHNARKGFREVIEKGYVRDLELTLKHASGSTADVLYNATVYRDQAGQVQGVFAAARDITARKRAEEELARYREGLEELVTRRTGELRQSEARFRGLVESTSDWIWEMDTEGTYTYASPQVEEILGYRSADLIGRRPPDIMLPGDVEAVEDYVNKLRQGKILALETVFLHGDHHAVTLETNSVPIMDEQGTVRGYRGISRDITERKRTEDALRERQETLNSILRVAPAGIGLLVNRAFATANDRVCEMTGYLRDELIGKSARILYASQEEFERVGSEKYRQIAAQGTGTVETQWQTKDGRMLNILLSSTPLDPAHLSRGVIFTALDITERKRAQDALQQSESQYRTLFEASTDAILLLEGDRIIECNPRTLAMFQVSREEIIANTPMDFSPPQQPDGRDSTEKAREEISLAMSGQPQSFEWLHMHGDGTPFHAEVNLVRMEQDGKVQLLAILRDITERKRAENALREGEQRLKEALAIARMGRWELDLADYTLFWSEGIYDIFEIDPKQFAASYEAFLDGVHPEDREAVNEAYLDSVTNHQPYEITHRLLMKDGRVKWVHEIGKTEYGPDGRPIRSMGMVQDITDRTQAQLALRETQERYRQLFEGSRDGIAMTDPNGNFIEANPAYCKLVGYSIEELRGMHFTDVTPPEWHEWEMSEVWNNRLLKNGYSGVYEKEYMNKEGRVFPVEVSSIVVRDDAGNIRFIWGTVRDITERKQAEQALRDSEEEFRRVFETSPVGMAMCEMDGTLIQANQAYLDIIGYTHNEICKLRYWDITPSEYYEREAGQLKSLAETGQYGPYEKEYVRKTGEHVPVLLNGMVVTGSDGTPRIWSLVTDITERKRAEAEIKALARFPGESPNPVLRISRDSVLMYVNAAGEPIAHLWNCQSGWPVPDDIRENVNSILDSGKILQMEVSAAGRFFSLVFSPILEAGYVNVYGLDITERKRAEDAVRHAAEELARSNQELEQFAYVASHDLQEPLRTVVGYLQLIERRYKDKLDDDANEFIDFAINGSNRMQNLINGLLSYSRVSTRGKQLTLVSSENALIQALRNLDASMAESQAQVTHDALPIVMGDEMQLAQVFQNLVGNAIKFRSEDRTPQVHIGARREPTHWLFWVEDNGIGIEQQYAERIFKIFQRLHAIDKYPGTGIGLSICKKIIERHGGRIWIESEFGQGTTVYFTVRHEGAS